MADAPYAPGLKRMKRHNGRTDLYWVADEGLVKKGYQPKTVRLFGDWPCPAVAARCQVLQAEMLEWAAGVEPIKNPDLHGTVAWICREFERDPESPFHGLRKDTRLFYSRYIKALKPAAGHFHLADVNGRDVRGWHKDWIRDFGKRGAYACVQTLRRVVGYGCELRSRDAIELAQVLAKTEFSAPKRRQKRPTYEQVVAYRKAAHELGRPSIALAGALQFDLGLRQKDVIGEWADPSLPGVEGWDWGVTWTHINANFVLQKPTSKSNGTEIAEHDLRLYPDIMAELPPRGVGPLVIDEHTGRPWSASHFRRQCAKVAKAAGWPAGLWNMDLRAGSISEAFDAGAKPEDVMAHATHEEMKTTSGYNRERVAQTSRVAVLKIERRTNLERARGNTTVTGGGALPPSK
jgi:hypothetical protein